MRFQRHFLSLLMIQGNEFYFMNFTFTALSISRITIVCHGKYFESFIQFMRLFQKDFQRNVQHSIQMPDITERNSNVHFILGNTGHV